MSILDTFTLHFAGMVPGSWFPGSRFPVPWFPVPGSRFPVLCSKNLLKTCVCISTFFCPLFAVMETQNKALAETILHLTAYHHFGKVDLSQKEITNPNVVKSALDYCLKNYKNEQARMDPDSAALDHWHSLFWFITLNYSLK